MADTFRIIPYVVRSAGTDVPPEEVQAAINSLANQTTVALNGVASDPTGPAGGDLSGSYPNPTVAAVHATSGTMSGVSVNSSPVGQTTPAAGAFTTLTATTPVGVTSGGTGVNALTANAVLVGAGSSPVSFVSPGTLGTIFSSGGTGVTPAFQSAASLFLAQTTNPLSQFAPTTSAQLAGVISDETGFAGSLVFSVSPTLTGTPSVPTAAAHTNTTQAASTAFVETEFASPPTAGVGSGTPSPGAFTTLSSTGNFTPSQTNGIVGTTTNNNANAGSIGELIFSNVPIGSTVALTNATATNITSITLPAGDWDLYGMAITAPAGTTTQTLFTASISGVSATQGVPPNGGAFVQLPFTAGGPGIAIGSSVGTVRVILAGSSTFFLVITVSFGVSTNAAYGFLGARRRR